MCPRVKGTHYFFRCPDCGFRMQRIRKGWACPNTACPVTRVRGNPMKGRIDRVEREARRRVTPLNDVDLADLGLHPSSESD